MTSGIAGELTLSPRFNDSGVQARPDACTRGHGRARRSGSETQNRHKGALALDTRHLTGDFVHAEAGPALTDSPGQPVYFFPPEPGFFGWDADNDLLLAMWDWPPIPAGWGRA